MAFLELINIQKSYWIDSHQVDVLTGVDLIVEDGKMMTIIGRSGAGKSTLLHIIGALDRPTSGQVLLNNEDIFSRNQKELARFRNRTIGFVFQFHHLLPEFTALENVMMPALIARKKPELVRNRANDLLNKVGLEDRQTHKPGELSGGEQQRIAVARALMNEPQLILADEPSGNLDQKNAQNLHQLLRRLCEQEKKSFIIVTHNEELAELSDIRVQLKSGKVYH
ncbi:MAG: lipoprotein ABC transporter ATP-binding protein [Candidatus Cloacimonetes bacterium 4572_55]|nr:MAG: lipoprotein ABC transporter ATP-binding protein [Candidatus Cloacimonetes bacterium 4572_55]